MKESGFPAPSSPPPDFDRVAALYRWAEYLALGPLLQRTRVSLLSQVLGSRNVLVLGDGDGRFLAEFLHRSPGTQATAVDASPAMLHRLWTRSRRSTAHLTILQADITELDQAGLDLASFDLVVSHFLLDCLSQDQVCHLAQSLAAGLPTKAMWLVSDFAIPSRHPWRFLGRAYVRGLYFAFRLLTGLRVRALPNIDAALRTAGFEPVVRIERLRGLLYSQLWRRADPSSSVQATSHAQPHPANGHPPVCEY